MRKLIYLIPIIFLIVATTFTKNSTKKIDKKIFQIGENIRVLEDRLELVLLDYNYLTSPKKLMEYSRLYFEDDLIQKKAEDLNFITIEQKNLSIEKVSNFDD